MAQGAGAEKFLLIVFWYFALFALLVYMSSDSSVPAADIPFIDIEFNGNQSINCRHTQQGAHFVTDDRGKDLEVCEGGC